MIPKPHYFTDSKGKQLGVYFAMNEWRTIEKKYPELASNGEGEDIKSEFLSELRQAVFELNEVTRGNLVTKSGADFLNEL